MRRLPMLLPIVASLSPILPAQTPSPLADVLRGTNASAIVLRVDTGALTDHFGNLATIALPGSVLKPFVLHTALAAGIITPDATISCPGVLTIAGHNLACTHPRDITVLDARQALANSCNAYFATLAQRMPAPLLLTGLRTYGLQPTTAAADPAQRALLALGVAGIRVSPLQLATAYRRLALQMQQPTDHAAATIRAGLLQSVDTGMAHAAHVEGIPIAGKTGSMHDASDPHGHGWFAGIVSIAGTEGIKGIAGTGPTPQVIVIYLPGGNGNDAANLARRWIEQTHRAKP